MSTTIAMTALGRRRTRRRISTSFPTACHSLPQPLDNLDHLPTPTLSSLRNLVLAHLTELEEFLLQLESPLSDLSIESFKTRGESTVEDAREWAKTGLEMLRSIRLDVCSHLPDLDFDFSVGNLVDRLPDVNTVPELMLDVRAHFADFQLSDFRTHLPDIHLPDEVRSRIDNVRARFRDLDFPAPLDYIPILNEHLESLHAYISGQIPSDINYLSKTPGLFVWHSMLDRMLSSHLYLNFKSSEKAVEDMFERATHEVKQAVQRSLNGSKLIRYVDLPNEWRNNPFVFQGYRFIPIDKWPLIILSLFALHNETLNIHTHLIPFLMWLRKLIPSFSTLSADMPLFLFTSFALFCLFSSTLYHTMIGCAHLPGMEICSTVDYVGIGWLISASVGTIVHYGFRCNDNIRWASLLLCFASGVAGTVLPFMKRFRQSESRILRVYFFLGLAFTGLAPLAYMSYIYSISHMLSSIVPIGPSVLSYVIGLFFYVTHFPESYLARRHRFWSCLDWIGGGSHAIWHAFIVLAISQHRSGMMVMKQIAEANMINGKCVA